MRMRRFFQYDVALRQHDLVVENEAAHPVSFEPHDELQPVARDCFVKSGVILGRKGVVAPTIAGDRSGEGARRRCRRAFKHQMLEEMGKPGFPDRIVGAADFVPNHLHHRRDAMVRHDHQLHAVVERESLRAESLRPRRRGEQGWCQERDR